MSVLVPVPETRRMKRLPSKITRINRLEWWEKVQMRLMALEDREGVESGHQSSHLGYGGSDAYLLAFDRSARASEWHAPADSQIVADLGRYKCNVYLMRRAASALKLDAVPYLPS